MVKAILLDVDNTLLDFNACAREAMISAFHDMAVPWDEAVFPVFVRVNDRLWREIERGRITVEELYQRRWCEIFRQLGIPGEGTAFERRFLAYLEESACPVEGAPELLEYLSDRYTLCAASNAPYAQQVKRLSRAGMLSRFSHCFISGQIGAAKPAPAFFDACIAALGVAREEVLVVGDSLNADIRGGAASGMRTCWYNPGGLPPDGEKPDYVISSLGELKTIL